MVLSWLREFCPTGLGVEELADLLSLRGVHVDGIERPWEGLSGVVVARVLSVRDHPSSEKLCLARVSYGSGEREVVVGVRNMKAGDLVPLAGPGAMVPTLPEPLRTREIRGVVSDGMICSPKELGISADHGGILILPPDTPVGADLKSQLGLDDVVLDIEIEANRPDLMSVYGVAREVAAATGTPVAPLDLSVEEADEKAEGEATVEVLDLDRCPRYVARVIRGVTVSPSPLAVQARLTAAGMRPLSNLVDATNYAMLEMGQPLHPFDLDLLSGRAVVVRRAEDGERLMTLDGVERSLSSEDLVIADREKAVAIAGVMGSASAEVHPGTADVLLESAYFEPTSTLRTSRRLGLPTEAALRFGRGADPENPPRGADLAARLIARWSGGDVLAGAIEVGGAPERRRVAVWASRATLLLGYEVGPKDVEDVFARLGMAATSRGDVVEVDIPGYRVDLSQEVDLIEEVARIQGYENLPATLPGIRQVGGFAPTSSFRRRVREAMVRSGLREAISLSFASRADLELTGHDTAVRVANPVSAEQGFLRTSLVPGLLSSVRRNADRGVRSVALFEVGHVFRPSSGEGGWPVDEREFAAAVLAGPAGSASMGERRPFDFFDAKGALEAVFAGLGVRQWDLGGPAGPPLHPARSAEILVSGQAVGGLGELHPQAAERLGLPESVALFELDLSLVAPAARTTIETREVPRFPPVHRDLAFVVDAADPAGEVQRALAEAGGDLVEEVTLFDVFTGPPIPEGKKSLAFSVDFRAPDRTLTDEEAERAVQAIRERLARKFGAELRSG